ncbi:MAG: phosphatidate cytidylyltransferase [Nitrosomonadales bacterium]|jgi:phosphatidate cytidylyltransferase|nr:MAG: phosphatidate cytidylyltransferase [Nitrosomonadales bacterium]
MLKTRVLTAVCALLLFLAALFYLSPIFWMTLLLALAVIGSWEWSKLAKFSLSGSIFYLVLTALIGGELLFVLSRASLTNPYTTEFIWLYAVTLGFWILVAPCLLKLNLPIKNQTLLVLIGWLLLLPTCLALYQLRAIDPLLLLGFMIAIWVSDTAAYFTGRAFGKHKLAPTISPGKTWEGVAGALIAVSIYALTWTYLAGEKTQIMLLVPLLLVLVVLGIIGDLFESLMKRQAGVKNSGDILPGHGGILDRIDALTSTLPVAVFVVLIFTV